MTREQLEKACDKLKEIDDLVHEAQICSSSQTADWVLGDARDLIPELAQYLEAVCSETSTTTN